MISISFFTLCLQAWAADADSAANSNSSAISKELNEVVVQASTGLRAQSAISNTEIIGQTQLVRAACCNLGESFSTNPSVDVSYKALLTLSYATPMKIWQFDLTGQLNGHGTLYDNSSYPTYFQLQAQIKSTFADFAEAFKKIGYSITAIKE